MNGMAEALVAHSFVESAERIANTLLGSVEIRNSRKPSEPPAVRGKVVGLCGQGGRHPYFEMPRRALEGAVERLMDTAILASPNALDTVSGVCGDLRRRTWFNSDTGCVNDDEPSLVPLLPPEEIWCDGRELPMDVWRLIAFEFDLISSAYMSGVDPSGIAYGSGTHNAILFADMMNRCGGRVVEFDVAEDGLPALYAGQRDPEYLLAVPLRQLFFEAGSLLTQLQTNDLAVWYPAVRYLGWLSDRPGNLKARDAFRDDTVDTRYKGLFSEEMAVGMMAVVLTERFGCTLINNTSEVPGSSGRGGLVADFVTSLYDRGRRRRTGIIAECKGSLRKRVSKKRREHAKDQVGATFAAIPGVRDFVGLTFCSTIYYEGQKKRTHCRIADPATDGASEEADRDPSVMYRAAYARMLRFVGFERAAAQVAEGRPAAALPSPDVDERPPESAGSRERRAYHRRGWIREYGASCIRDLERFGLVIDSRVLSALKAGLNSRTIRELEPYLVSHQRQRTELLQKSEATGASFINNLGVGLVDYIE